MSRSLGIIGEDIALQFLENKGYILREKNFCIPGGEIDLIMQEEDIYIFVEVKMRSQGNFGTPEESITPQKLRFLQRSVHKYFLKKNISLYDIDFRMDLIAIEKNRNGQQKIRHYENAFCFDDF